MFRILFFLIVISLQINTSLVAKERSTFCDDLFQEIKSQQIEDRLDLYPLSFYWGIETGLILDFIYNSEIQDYEYVRDDDGNLIVFHTRKESDDGNEFKAFNLLSYGDKIISFNDKNVSNLNDKQIDNIIYPQGEEFDFIDSDDQIDDSLNLRISYKTKGENKIKEAELNFLYTVDNTIYPNILINNFKSIDSKRGLFELNFTFDYSWDSLELRDTYLKLFKKYDISDYRNEISYCEFNEEQFAELSIWHPSLDFSNIVQESDDESSKMYIFRYIEGIESPDGLGTADIVFQWDGTALFYSDFNFRSFPFDSQVLTLDIANVRDEVPIETSWLKSSSYYDSVKNMKLFDWTFSSADIVPSFFFDNYWNDFRSKYSIQIRVDRNISYYIFKIFFPIMIILVVAWSALWINPRELQSRLTVTIVCLLSLIAYNYTYEKDLPKLDYLTLLDYFILLSYLFAAVPTLLSIIAFSLIDKQDSFLNFDRNTKIFGPVIFISIFVVISASLLIGNDNAAMFLRPQ